MAAPRCRVAVAQLCATADLEANFAAVAAAFAQATARGCRLLALPEAFEWLGAGGPPAARAVSSPLSSPLSPAAAPAPREPLQHDPAFVFARYRALCRTHGLWASFGGFHERLAADSAAARDAEVVLASSTTLVGKSEPADQAIRIESGSSEEEPQESRQRAAAESGCSVLATTSQGDAQQASMAAEGSPTTDHATTASNASAHATPTLATPVNSMPTAPAPTDSAMNTTTPADSTCTVTTPPAADERTGNTHVLVDPEGRIVAAYGKTHLFDVDTADGVFHESAFTRPGERLVAVAGTPAGTLGLSVCYDLRFPALYAALRAAGASVLLIPSAFMPSTGAAHWEVLMRARAIETQCFVMAAAQVGQNHATRRSYGNSIIVDPWGRILARCDGETPGLAIADLDLSELETVRRKMPVASHQRTDLYGLPATHAVDTIIAPHVEEPRTKVAEEGGDEGGDDEVGRQQAQREA